MGERHSRLEYHSHVYTAAYTNMFARIVELAMSDRHRFTLDDITALTRVTMYDMELTVGASTGIAWKSAMHWRRTPRRSANCSRRVERPGTPFLLGFAPGSATCLPRPDGR